MAEDGLKSLLAELRGEAGDSWGRARAIVATQLTLSPQLPVKWVSEVERSLRSINSLLTLGWVYSLGLDISSYYRADFREQFITLRRNPHCYSQLWKWIDAQPEPTQAEAIELIVDSLTSLLTREMSIVKVEDLGFLLAGLHRFQVKRERQAAILLQFVSNLQALRLTQMDDYEDKSTAIVRLVVTTAAQLPPQSGNLGLLLDEFLLSKRDVDNFCNLHSDYLLELPAETLLKVFREVSRAGLAVHSLTLLMAVSRFLANEEEFYKLRLLYEQLILGDLCRRGKCCNRVGVAAAVLDLCQLYVVGFLTHCHIGRSGVDCLLFNVQHLSEAEQKKWVQLAFLATERSNLGAYIISSLPHLGSQRVQRWNSEKTLSRREVWEITTRSIRKHKAYKRYPSQLKGITNNSCQCYIITVVQALYLTQALPKLLSARNRLPRVSAHLHHLFQALATPTSSTPNVEALKRDGPPQFEASESQEDAQQYLLALMAVLESEFGEWEKGKGRGELQGAFEWECVHERRCDKCKNVSETREKGYVWTLSHGEELLRERSEQLTDYDCDQCSSRNVSNRTQLQPHCQVLIVHINRFSVSAGVAKKELPTQRIRRTFGSHELVGMIFHIGKNVQSGHYVYYQKIGDRRWAQLNDANSSELELDCVDEEFEKEMKAEKTPYLLFYKRTK